MNDQQLTLIPDETDRPSPVWTKKAIENLLDELTETRRQRNELASKLEATNAELRLTEQLLLEARGGWKNATEYAESLEKQLQGR